MSGRFKLSQDVEHDEPRSTIVLIVLQQFFARLCQLCMTSVRKLPNWRCARVRKSHSADFSASLANALDKRDLIKSPDERGTACKEDVAVIEEADWMRGRCPLKSARRMEGKRSIHTSHHENTLVRCVPIGVRYEQGSR